MSRAALRFRGPAAARTAVVDSPSVSDKRRRRDNEDWRIEPCQKCKTLTMLWWRFCPFCGTQLPTVLDGKVVKEARPRTQEPIARNSTRCGSPPGRPTCSRASPRTSTTARTGADPIRRWSTPWRDAHVRSGGA